jgi:hypothetical protein
MSLQGISIERMCQLAQVSRASFYRSLQERLPVEEEMEVRSTIQQIVLEHRSVRLSACDSRTAPTGPARQSQTRFPTDA